MMDISRICED